MNKQALTGALTYQGVPGDIIHDAARLVERLLPGECPHGKTESHNYTNPIYKNPWPEILHCDGQVWDEGIVEAVAKALNLFDCGPDMSASIQESMARVVLSALVELLTVPQDYFGDQLDGRIQHVADSTEAGSQ